MKTLLSFALIAALATAAEASPLEQTVGPLRFEKTPLPAALRALAEDYDRRGAARRLAA